MEKVEMNVKLQLAADDCQRLAMKAAGCGLTISELLENFVNDLVCGADTNGSDERMYAEQWFERCWFSYQPEETLLRHLIEWGCIEEFLDNYRYLQERQLLHHLLDQHLISTVLISLLSQRNSMQEPQIKAE